MAQEPDFPLCIGDGLPVLQETLQNGDGSAPDLSQPGTTITLVIQDENHVNAAWNGTASFVGSGPSDPTVQYPWNSTDVTNLNGGGWFNYRWVVNFPGNPLPETFPNGTNPRRLFVSPRT